jgi:hypothetical protein
MPSAPRGGFGQRQEHEKGSDDAGAVTRHLQSHGGLRFAYMVSVQKKTKQIKTHNGQRHDARNFKLHRTLLSVPFDSFGGGATNLCPVDDA